MADSLPMPKATSHTRSISLPSRSHPLTVSVEDHLNRLKASEATSSSSLSSICSNLNGLKDFLEQINDLLQLPQTQQTLFSEQCDRWTEEVLDGSLVLLDVCSTAKDVLVQMKESVQVLESSLRRKRGTECDLANEVSAYMISRKKINKMVSKCIGNLKKFEKTSSSLALTDKSSYLVAIPKRVQSDAEEETNGNEIEKIDGALYALNTQKSSKDVKVLGVQNVQKQLETLEMAITGT
ncbi:hypothetical protein F0562_026881 [Nyssa sinensis]|uniref:Uncharacterized protein n=1 Tax=Nyssa sinensis TaxID=561372 RepID=A0A5J5B6F3_9ASTE|nr:hypothetical protein F0562_026881 [Nyssa sinensis]